MRLRLYWLALLVLPPLLAPTLSSFGLRLMTLVGLYALLGIGYQLVFGQLGALNLAQGALFGVGAYAAALTAPTLGPYAFLAAMLAAVVVAAIVVVPILRLQSHYFALATLALASLVDLAALHDEGLTGGANGLVGFASFLPRGGALLAIVWPCLIAAVLGQLGFMTARRIEGARLIREAPLVAATLGINARRWRFQAFVAGGALAGLAGGFSAAVSGVVSPDATSFPIMLLCLSSVVLGGARHPMGAVLGAVIAVCLPELFRSFAGAWLLAYAVATLVVVLWVPPGLAGLIDGWMPRAVVPAKAPASPRHLMPSTNGKRLVLSHVRKSFGGVEALRDVSLGLARGEIVGLVGPNGSGKTTVLNVISGLEPADGGAILLDDRRLDRLPAHAIARAGIARTFQAPLPGESRRAGIDRALATGSAFVLFDEPMAGASVQERAEVVALLGSLRIAGYGVLIVDHDIDLLSKVCDRLVALDRGRVVS
jgi:branched-chain amino acid transport system permease protein